MYMDQEQVGQVATGEEGYSEGVLSVATREEIQRALKVIRYGGLGAVCKWYTQIYPGDEALCLAIRHYMEACEVILRILEADREQGGRLLRDKLLNAKREDEAYKYQ